ncbi:MAG: hypothetical protein IJY89_01345, partial [Clostridia bacterium]|nr:hypothetical protein [Clostridia bacterium]
MRKTNTYFTLDILGKKIRGSEHSLKLANKGNGDAYEQLMALMPAHPEDALEVVTAKSNASKETDDGVSYQFRKDYIARQEDS